MRFLLPLSRKTGTGCRPVPPIPEEGSQEAHRPVPPQWAPSTLPQPHNSPRGSPVLKQKKAERHIPEPDSLRPLRNAEAVPPARRTFLPPLCFLSVLPQKCLLPVLLRQFPLPVLLHCFPLRTLLLPFSLPAALPKPPAPVLQMQLHQKSGSPPESVHRKVPPRFRLRTEPSASGPLCR